MVDIEDIPDFPGMPGQGNPDAVGVVSVMLVNAPLDRDYKNVAVNKQAVLQFVADEIGAGRGREVMVQRWDPWSPLDVPIAFSAASLYNYARIFVGGKSFFGFLDAEYLNKNVTRFNVTPDYWTTFEPGIGYSHVVRGHVAVAASAGGDTSYCLEPEPFSPSELIGYGSYQTDPLGNPRVAIVSTTNLTSSGFVPVDGDVRTDSIPLFIGPIAEESGDVDSPVPVGAIGFSNLEYAYSYGEDDASDLFYFPYSDDSDRMYRPVATGSLPSKIDGIPVEGGVYVANSIGDALSALSVLAHTPWLAQGIHKAILLPGGSGSSSATIQSLSAFGQKPDSAATGLLYVSDLSTEFDTVTTVAGTWYSSLPSAYDVWTKLRTHPYSSIEIGNLVGATQMCRPQDLTGGSSLRVHTQGVWYPRADIIAWIDGDRGTRGRLTGITLPLGASIPVFEVGRDVEYAGHAAAIAANRASAVSSFFRALQVSSNERAFTLASANTTLGTATMPI